MLTRTDATDVGLVRPINEDSYICLGSSVYAVADGMGGHAAGEIASRLLVETAKEMLGNPPANMVDENLLEQVIVRANQRIIKKAAQDKSCAGMGTTASILYLNDDTGIWAHVGDSRIYLFRAGDMQQITKDHSLVWDLMENGTITAAEAQQHPKRNLLTRAVGVDEDLKIDTGRFATAAGDKFLLCSDGLTNMLSEAEIKEIVLDHTVSDKAAYLISRALQAGGNDNVTAIVVEKTDA